MAEVPENQSENSDIKDDPPTVSALVSCYNAAEFLKRTLDSLAEQTWSNLEILIGDDCSTDNTLKVVRAFARGRHNVRVLERSQNLGWLKNSNDLMANATGEFLFFAFHDDVVEPNYVEQLANALGENPDAILAYSDMEVFEPDKTSQIWKFDQISGHISTFHRGCVMACAPSGWWVPNRGLFRARAFKTIGGIRPNAQGEYSADWTWLLHMSLLGEFVRVPMVLCHKYYQKGSLSKTWPHVAEQRNALRRAGIKEIEMSQIRRIQKTLLKALLLIYGWRRRIRLRAGLRRALSWRR